MAIDPATGIDIPSPSDDLRRRDRLDHPANVDLEQRTPSFWIPIVIAVALLFGVAYIFFGPHTAGPNVRADAGAVTKSEPSPN